jgi:hypothetical protein
MSNPKLPNFRDPAVVTLIRLAAQFESVFIELEPGLRALEPRIMQLELTQKISKLSFFRDDCLSTTGTAGLALEHMLTHSQELDDLLVFEECLLENLIVELQGDPISLQVTDLLQSTHSEHESLTLLLRSLTPKHIALQRHLEWLVWADQDMARNPWSTELPEPYRQLTTLRDEMFLTPRRGLLTDYLKAVEVVKANAASDGDPIGTAFDLVADELMLRLEQATVELETLSMLESLESDSESKVDPYE